MMPPLFWIASQQPSPHLPSRVAPAQENSSTQSGLIALIIVGAIAFTVVSILGFKKYQQYRHRQQIKTLERLWQIPYRKRLR
jgi:hypothetical protein